MSEPRTGRSTHARRRPVALLSILAIGIVLGCSLETRSRLMHFFFEYPEAQRAEKAPGATDEAAPTQPTGREPLPKVASRHAPFVVRECQSCHAAGKGQKPRSDFSRVCEDCHESYFEYRRFVHAPVASGDCQQCHLMHVSRHAALLTGAQSELCISCHEADAVEGAENTYHRGIDRMTCTACHDAHFGKTHLLLKPEELRPRTPEESEAPRISDAEP